jgi:RimJ/RimL family protein N-acetyltransferase
LNPKEPETPTNPLALSRIVPNNLLRLKELYDWETAETERERFTCRPVKPAGDFQTFFDGWKRKLEESSVMLFVLHFSKDPESVLGKITQFDFNPRNQSAEFGYYLPPKNRGSGFGKVMLRLFLNEVFHNPDFPLSKIYATTAAGNIPSIKLLERAGFQLDGRIREHYWFAHERQDQLHFSLLKREFLRS